MPLWALLVLAAGCKENCYERLQPDSKADFSSLRLSGRLLCNPSGTCDATFTGTTMQLTIPGASDKDVLIYDVQYQGTHEQTQNVMEDSGGVGVCVKYRRQTWTVPTVTMSLRSATRNGQPLAVGPDATQLAPAYQSLAVVTHYVERMKGDEYVGVLVRDVPASGGSYSHELPLTKNGNQYQFVHENP